MRRKTIIISPPVAGLLIGAGGSAVLFLAPADLQWSMIPFYFMLDFLGGRHVFFLVYTILGVTPSTDLPTLMELRMTGITLLIVIYAMVGMLIGFTFEFFKKVAYSLHA